MIKIGITIDLRKSIWSNGINQNAIYLANLLKKIGYDTELIHPLTDNLDDIDTIKTISILESYKNKYDLIIQLGFTVTSNMMVQYKHMNHIIKLVSYKCGNEFLVDMESILFDASKDRTNAKDGDNDDPEAIPDQIWSIPQMENSCLQYYSYMLKQDKATVVPFIWEPMAIEDHCKDHGFSTYKIKDLKKIGIMEPNLSVMKNLLIPVLAADIQYTNHSNIEHVYMIGADIISSRKRLVQIISKTKLFKDKKISADSRVNTVDALNKYVDIVLSWQWENNLNYLWLDVAWLGWPVIHNGSLCQDVGYYYDGFDINGAQTQIQNVIKNHNSDLEYLDRNRNIIKRYTSENDDLKKNYKILIENVLNNTFNKYTYDWKTNSVF